MPSPPHFRRLHFSLKDRVVSFLSESFFDNFTYTVRHGLIQGMKRKGGLGFLPAACVSSRGVEPEEEFFRGLNLTGTVVYDIGAFHGIMTLFFARHARAVVSYEPHPLNFRRLQENISLNNLHNVTAFNRGIGDRDSFIELASDPRMPGAASGDPAIVSQIVNSLSQAEKVRISVARLDDEIEQNRLPLPDLIKIDIEGMELSALQGMPNLLQGCRPQLYLEMHGATENDKEQKAAAILDFLARSAYRSILHVESGRAITPSAISIAREGHLFCVAE